LNTLDEIPRAIERIEASLAGLDPSPVQSMLRAPGPLYAACGSTALGIDAALVDLGFGPAGKAGIVAVDGTRPHHA